MSNIINIGGTSGGSGSSVVANPQGAATDTLNKLQVDGTIYGVSGGGGSGYTETTLWSGSETPSTSGTQITLSDNISNYDEIIIVMDTDYVGTCSFPVSQLTIGESYIGTIYAPDDFGPYWSYDSDTQVTIKSQSGVALKTYTKVIGIKYGNGTQTFHNYSTAEKIVGEWIDGSTLYEKTIIYSGNIPQGTYATIYSALTYDDVDMFMVTNSSVKLENINTWFTQGSKGGTNYDLAINDALGVHLENFGTGNYAITDVIATIRYTKSTT